MPEIGEVARIVHFLRKHLVNRHVASVLTQNDDIVYGKVGTSADAFAKAIKGRTVLDARQQGKYFWLVMDQPPHPLMHFGMSGWMKFSNEETFYYSSNRKSKKSDDAADEPTEGTNGKKSKSKKKKSDEDAAEDEAPEWPPKYWKFILQMEGEPSCECAFIDARRLGRIRLIDAPAEELRNTTPLKENGPDPVIDKDILTVDWLQEKVRKKRVPIKAFLLEQSNISGVGNWVGDEVLYNAKIHPEQYSNTLTDEQIARLHKSLTYVCGLACEVLADSEQFPEEWLFKHRWNKGKKGDDANVLPNGEKIVHLTVGGRTSAIVPSVQKKTGPVAGDVDGAQADGASSKTMKKGAKRKVKDEGEEEDDDVEQQPAKKGKSGTPKKSSKEEVDSEATPASNKQSRSTPKNGRKQTKSEDAVEDVDEDISTTENKSQEATTESTGRRRSARHSKV